MSDLIDTTEMYLRTVIELEEEGIVPMRARIAERLGQSSPTVSQTVSRMERDGLLHVGDDRALTLTGPGRSAAVSVMRRHRLAECMLVEVIKLPLALVHDEACRWEHVLTDEVERRVFTLLGEPVASPFGCPIPGRTELGSAEAEPFLDGVVPATQAAGPATVVRLGENAQRESGTLAGLVEIGCLPGAVVTAEELEAGWRLSVGAASTVVPDEAAEDVFVAAPA